ncbi:MAG: endopeptidase La, partial [Anaerolineales bacterium]|nr:endopeptidase La [Anaerolineales bacterium]
VRKDVGMSGEITLRGRVIPIGGVREKVLAAYRLKLKTVIIPSKNEKDLIDIPRQARESLDIQLVRSMDDVLSIALLPELKKVVKNSSKTRRKGKSPGAFRPSASA